MEVHLPHQPGATCPPVLSARSWAQILGRYRKPSHARSIIEIAITFGPLSALWALAWTALYLDYWWLCVLLAIPAAGFLVRLFMIQHDCGHGSFFYNRSANDWVGRVIGVLTLTLYDYWRRVLYRVYRHPSVMFGIGPAYLFILKHRLPIGLLRAGWQPWLSTMATNSAVGVIAAGLIWLIGIGPFLFVHLPIMLLAGSVGVWLFYVQHQFETTFWAHNGEWTFQEAALHGSSHYDLPGI